MGNQLVISPDRKTALTLSESGELISLVSEIEFFVKDLNGPELMRVIGQKDQTKALAMPEHLNWMINGSPIIYPVSSIKKVIV